MPYNWPQWKKANPEAERVARRFRGHVRTPSNPRGRIHREKCAFCPQEPVLVPSPIGEIPAVGAHHVDYARAFLGVWLCEKCHRAVERGELRILKRHLWDYTSLVPTKQGLWREGPRRKRGCQTPAVEEEAPPF